MGTNISSFSERAEVLQELVQFTKVNKQAADALWNRFSNKLNKFALDLQEYALMMNVSVSEARQSFQAFDADSKGIIDSYQTIAGLVLLSSLTMAEKAKFLFRQYDFDHSGTLSMDEVTIMFQTLASAAAKVDANHPVAVSQRHHVQLAVTELEALVQGAFDLSGADDDGEISETDFIAFCFVRPPPPVYNFTRYWQSLLRRVHIADDTLWQDPNFPANGSSLYRDPAKPPPGCPPARVVRWLRPSEFCPGGTRLFVGGKAGGDVKRGALADAWFLNALALVTGNTRPHEYGIRDLFPRTGQEEQGRYCFERKPIHRHGHTHTLGVKHTQTACTDLTIVLWLLIHPLPTSLSPPRHLPKVLRPVFQGILPTPGLRRRPHPVRRRGTASLRARWRPE